MLTNPYSAEKLACQLGPYMLEAHTQAFVQSPSLREIEPSPVEALSYNLTAALLSLGINHKSLQELVSDKIWAYLDRCAHAAESISRNGTTSESWSDTGDGIHSATVAISLIGFLDAAATHAHFWSAAERLNLLRKVKKILSDSFLMSLETAFSGIRNSRTSDRQVKEWRRYVRNYAAIGRPLGAMLLQRSFMWFLVASTSLLVAEPKDLRGNDVLELMMSPDAKLRQILPQNNNTTSNTIETMASLAAEEIGLLEDGADYLRMGSASQQRLAFAVKAAALTSYLNCALLNEDAADTDMLITWLEDTLADPVQMADQTLARAVLRCMALAAKLDPSFAPNVSRSLPRFIVQGGPVGPAVGVASSCLAYALQLLSQDAVISTLYTLGNVLSSGGNTDRILGGGDPALNGTGSPTFYNGGQSTGSAISLVNSGEEETAIVYGNVIQAICDIANHCGDDKITALAQSMLLQKINKVSKAVDARIIKEAAVLSTTGGPLEFKSLLKLYVRLGNDGVTSKNDHLLTAVSSAV